MHDMPGDMVQFAQQWAHRTIQAVPVESQRSDFHQPLP